MDQAFKEKLEDPQAELDEIHSLWEEHGVVEGSMDYWRESSMGVDRALKPLVVSIICISSVRFVVGLFAPPSAWAWVTALVVGILLTRVVLRWLGWR